MGVFQAESLQALSGFSECSDQLAIVKQEPLNGAGVFFQKLMQTSFNVVGQVSKGGSAQDVGCILGDVVPVELKSDPFYAGWVLNMANVCEAFCDVLGSEVVGFCLATERGCRRYHVDNVPLRLLVTYAGRGTEWLPDTAADRRAWVSGGANEDIVKNPSARQFMDPWDVALFRGGSKGLLHRTPDAALGEASILMRLDHASFWESILKDQQSNSLSKVARL